MDGDLKGVTDDAASEDVAQAVQAPSPEDIQAALRVLTAAGKDRSIYDSKPFRPIRVALVPLLEYSSSARFGGASAAEYTSAQERKKRSALERNAKKLEDRLFLEKTRLRAGRQERLIALTAQADGAGASVPFLLDGVADADFIAGPLAPGLQPNLSLLADGPTQSAGDGDARADEGGTAQASMPPGADAPRVELHEPRACYTCKRRFRELHEFYDSLCPECASLNFRKRNQSADLSGRIALVTGARVKIGFCVALKLLRAGARVIATSRFPVDAAERFAAQPDAAIWTSRLDVVGLDFRDIAALERFCAKLLSELPRLDIIVNNACQTVRRPAAFYAPLMDAEVRGAARFKAETAHLLKMDSDLAVPASSVAARSGPDTAHRRTLCDVPAADAPAAGREAAPSLSYAASSALLSQVAIIPEDVQGSDASRALPSGLVDVNAQQVDLRTHNSWLSRLADVSTPELVEVLAINTMAPYVLIARLKPLMISGGGGGGRVGAADAAAEDGDQGADDSEPATLAASILKASGAKLLPRGKVVGGAAKRARRDTGGAADVLGAAAASGVPPSRARFIINVSSMEGKFYRSKLPTHPHTNMAKAALNMMTRTSAGEFAEDFIYMNAVDTG